MTTVAITTAEQLFAASELGRCELIQGELVMMSPGGLEHGCIVANLITALTNFVKPRGLGRITGADTGFQISSQPDTVRAPDVAFLRAQRVPGRPDKGFVRGAPDLAVEVVSPTDRAGEVAGKVQDWLGAGCALVWVVEPKTQTVSIYRGGGTACVLSRAESLDGGDLLPGFSMPVAEVFA